MSGYLMIFGSTEAFMSLLFNGVIMVGLVTLFLVYAKRFDNKKLTNQIIAGLVIGLIIFLVMLHPFEGEQKGVYYDSRNVALTISGAFFGIIPTTIGALIGIIYRIYLGGIGMLLGIIEIITGSLIGIFWPKVMKKYLPKYNYLGYYLMGLVAHLLLYVYFYVIPNDIVDNFIKNSLFLYTVIYPLFTVALALLINNLKNYYNLSEINRIQGEILSSSMNAPKNMEIYVIDNNGNYLAFNKFHVHRMKKYNQVDIQKGMNFIDLLKNPLTKERLSKAIHKAYQGIEHSTITELHLDEIKFIEERFSPLLDDQGKIIGATIFSCEVTDKVMQAKKLEKLSYYDALTGVYNRRYFEEKYIKYFEEFELYSVIFFDINGLKIINEALSHRFGDKILTLVSSTIKEVIGEKGDTCRIGGDEFVVLLPNTTYEHASELAERCKYIIDRSETEGIRVSASYGVETKKPGYKMNQLLINAENKMYTNKVSESASHRSNNIQTILKTLELIEPNVSRHSFDVGKISLEIGRKFDLSKSNLELLKMIANLHDIGKIGIDPKILNKPGKLTDEEYEIVKRHPEIGYRLLSDVPEYREIAYDILSHHERYDGKGYPNGLKGEDIPIRARIISVADAFDAMISDRPYRKAMSLQDAILEIRRNSGTQFDPLVVKYFEEVLKELYPDMV